MACSIWVTPLGIVTLVRPEPANAYHSRWVTLLGMVMPVRPVQLPNVDSLIRVRLPGRVTFVRPAHAWNAKGSMFVTLLAIAILVRRVQPSNAAYPMEVTL